MDARQTVIRRLDEKVVNRIAAGEVIQRPANAVKELLENSLDAGATSITVSIKFGGLKLLQILDNGHGIHKDDLEIVCERFTTSKLKEFDDLKAISTFGFRGEALASISHVAHLSIVSRTPNTQCSYKASYLDGRLKEKPKPTAGNVGTQITVEDLFYNVPTRQKVFKSPSEEHQKIANVITRYAVHNSGISFTLRKLDGETALSKGVSVKTQAGATCIENIASLFGRSVGGELIEVLQEDKPFKLKINGYVSNANCSMKKMVFLLFINNRLVECSGLRQALNAVYQAYLPKGGHPFVYLSLKMDANNLDVNVHPTKHEVRFLHEEAVIESVQTAVDAALLKCDSSRKFYTQKLLPTSLKVSSDENSSSKDKQPTQNNADKPTKKYDHQLVRTDSKLQKLDSFLQRPQTSTDPKSLKKLPPKRTNTGETVTNFPKRRQIRLTSVLELQESVESSKDDDITKLLHDHTFVGCVDAELALIQHSTNLYLVNTAKLTQELFYQIMLRDFGNFAMFQLSEPASIFELAMLGLELKESGWSPADGSKENLAKYIVTFLSGKANMLKDYFCLDIVDENIVGIPLLLKNYSPALERLPLLVLRLSTEVNWESEKACFDTFCREMARFYTVRRGITDSSEPEEASIASSESSKTDSPGPDENGKAASCNWTIEHVVYPAIRSYLKPGSNAKDDGTFIQLANLTDLYKVFERC
ncbi:unnamed protein product [Clavelina lepadiformis]|uniref:DNA mismatch repair protein S5 domain-containing protein n=1 Tax=Clavelina lepadiformis TaxID=159417 RepID=A0ABP0G3A9_CLALP